MRHHSDSAARSVAGKLCFLASLMALFLLVFPRTAEAAEVKLVDAAPPSETQTETAASQATPSSVQVLPVEQDAQQEDAADPMVIQLPYRETSAPGFESNLFSELAGKTYYLTLDGEVLVTSPRQETLIQLVSDTVDLYITDHTTACSLAQTGQLELCYGYVTFGVSTDLTAAAETLAEQLLVSTTEQTVELVTVPAGQQRINDPTRYVEEGDEVYPGQDGLNQVSAETTYLNGVKQTSTVVSSSVVVEMRDEVIYVAAKVHPEYIWPAEGVISSHFGHRNIGIGSTNHKGLDIAAYYGSDIVAAKAGTVIVSGRQGGYGKVVKIDHGDGSVTVYAHNSSLCVEEGDWVEQGDVIAKAGSTGTSSGTHCHFEIQVDGEAVDPELYLAPEDGR